MTISSPNLKDELKILQEKLNYDLAFANEFLFVNKLTEENLKKHLMAPKINLITQIYLSLIAILNLTLKNSIKLFIRSFSTPIKINKKEFKSDTLFLSHFFTHLDVNQPDQFFGKIKLNLYMDHHFDTVYVDHTGKNNLIVFNSHSETHISEIIVPKKRELSIILKHFLFSIYLFFSTWFQKPNELKCALLAVARAQCTGSTLRNSLLIEAILIAFKGSSIKEIWITFEGHPYERVLISKLSNKYPEIKINAYQHAPIVQDQLGFFSILENFGDKMNIFTCGNITKDYILDMFPRLNKNIIVLGSEKSASYSTFDKFKLSQKELGAFTNTIVFLPEGTRHSLIAMFEFAKAISELNKNLYLILRPHPRTLESDLGVIGEIQRFGNIEVSKRDLYSDFKRSKFCVYRGSATAIQGMFFGLIPVYFKHDGEFNIDPLSISNFYYPSISSPQEFLSALDLINLRSGSSLRRDKDQYYNFAKNYFTEIKFLPDSF
jgi:hypothetical protein